MLFGVLLVTLWVSFGCVCVCDYYFRCFVFLLWYSNKVTIWLCSRSQRVQSLWTSICRRTIMVNTISEENEEMNEWNEDRERERKENRDGYVYGKEISCVCAPKIDRHMHSENRINTFIKLYGEDMILIEKQQLQHTVHCCKVYYSVCWPLFSGSQHIVHIEIIAF